MIIPNGAGLHNVRSHAILQRAWLPPFAADATCGQALVKTYGLMRARPMLVLDCHAPRLDARHKARFIYVSCIAALVLWLQKRGCTYGTPINRKIGKHTKFRRASTRIAAMGAAQPHKACDGRWGAVATCLHTGIARHRLGTDKVPPHCEPTYTLTGLQKKTVQSKPICFVRILVPR